MFLWLYVLIISGSRFRVSSHSLVSLGVPLWTKWWWVRFELQSLNVLMMSVSQKTINSNKKLSDLVKEEAVTICEKRIWSSFLCILALALLTSRKINCYYPEIGSIRYRTMFNCIIQSRILQISNTDIQILFSYEGVLMRSTFQHNHYVPSIFLAGKKPALKRIILNKKGEKEVKRLI